MDSSTHTCVKRSGMIDLIDFARPCLSNGYSINTALQNLQDRSYQSA